MHKEALTKKGRELFARLASFQGFYLAGGTALALQIGHRRSIDFDMFTTAALPSRLLPMIKRVFSSLTVMVTYSSPEQLDVLIDEVKVTFLQYEYPLIDRLVDLQKVPAAGIREIAAMKAFSIGKRLSYKDYVDWYFLLSEKLVELPGIISLAGQKYSHDFNDRLFLGQLASVGEVHEVPIDFLRNEVDRDVIQRYLEQAVSNFPI